MAWVAKSIDAGSGTGLVKSYPFLCGFIVALVADQELGLSPICLIMRVRIPPHALTYKIGYVTYKIGGNE
jgi:hypothetical protein